MRVARQYFSGNRLTLISRMGFPKKDKLEKPGFKPVNNRKEESSDFARQFKTRPFVKTEPRFLDLKKDAEIIEINPGVKLYHTENPYNQQASLKIKFKAGRYEKKHLDFLAQALNYTSTSNKSLAEFKAMLASLQCAVYFRADNYYFTIDISGREKSVFQAAFLLRKLLDNPQISPASRSTLFQEYHFLRKDEWKRPSEMGMALLKYAWYGKESEYLNRPTVEEVKKMSEGELAGKIIELGKEPASFHYCGMLDGRSVADSLRLHFPILGKERGPRKDLFPKLADKNRIFLVHDPEARQSQVYFTVSGQVNPPSREADLVLLQEYLCGGFSGLLLQEVREYRSLVYSVDGSLFKPVKKENPLIFYAEAGCQADKTNEVVETITRILNKMPEYPERIPVIKSFFETSVSSRFPDFRNISGEIEYLEMKGESENPLQRAYQQMGPASFESMMDFYRSNLKNRPVTITIYGNSKKMNLEKLREAGELIQLSKNEIVTQ